MRSLLLIPLLGLTACGPSAAERRTAFMTNCTHSEFSQRQCQVLYSIKESADDANSSASLAVGFSATTLGVSAARSGR